MSFTEIWFLVDMIFSIGGEHIPSDPEQNVKGLGRVYSFPLTGRNSGGELQKLDETGLK